MSMRVLLPLFIGYLFIFRCFRLTVTLENDDAEDLSFLEEEDNVHGSVGEYSVPDPEDEYLDDPDGINVSDAEYSDDESYTKDQVNEKDIVVLTQSNFTDFLEKNRYIMVEFYAPWCGHCQSLAPEYAAAATELKGEAVLAKVDATEQTELAEKYDVQGFPTILFFVDGLHKPYQGQRTKDDIVIWVKKKTGPDIHNISTLEDAKKILDAENKLVLGFMDSLVASDSRELTAASKVEDDINFYQTSDPNVAKLFHVDAQSKRPILVLLKKGAENISYFDGPFIKSAIAEFVFANKHPLVITFNRENAPLVFESPIKKQILLFASSDDSIKFLEVFQEAAKVFKGKAIFVYVDMDNEDVGKPVSDHFGISNSASIIGYTGNEDAKKYRLDEEITSQNLKVFVQNFLDDRLQPFYKSDPIPPANDGHVKIVVGNNFDQIVLDESKDVLLEIYAPWCQHCQAFEPIYNKLARYLSSIPSLVIAKMDGTTNEHPRAQPDGFPTILFFSAGNKSFDPLTVDVDRTVVAIYKFIKRHASIPFKLQRPDSSSKEIDSKVNDKTGSKDEL